MLKAGTAPPGALRREGDYDRMMQALLDAPGREWASYDVEHGVFPDRPEAHDAYLITGSRHSAYDPLPWIERLLETVRGLHARQIPLIGICFGHQVVAQALGGEVGLNPRGWEVGVRPLALTEAGESGLRALAAGAPPPRPLRLLQSHRDAVLRAPAEAERWAGSERTEHELLAIGRHILTLQGHPEFVPETVGELIAGRRDEIPAGRAEAGLASLRQPHHGGWMRAVLDAFLRRVGV